VSNEMNVPTWGLYPDRGPRTLRFASLAWTVGGSESAPNRAEHPAASAVDPWRKLLRLEKYWLATSRPAGKFCSFAGIVGSLCTALAPY